MMAAASGFSTTDVVSKKLNPIFDGKNFQIFCYGSLLETVQMSHIFKDSKTFVDMKLKQPPNVTLELFDQFMQNTNNTPTQDEVKQFVSDNFDEPESEFQEWIPDDWHEHPKYIEAITDADLRQWAVDLNHIWLKLGRKMTPAVANNQDLYSIIYVPNPVIVPGGRFREFYYWDSLWIVKGLLRSEMYHTTRGMLENFLSIIERLGYIPNGGRIYYAARSQPPVLCSMIKEYVQASGDIDFAKTAVEILDREFEFWTNNRTHVINGYQLSAYGSKIDATGPRPESYREDIELAEDLPTLDAKHAMYAELQAGAESGLDFSSRWFITSDGSSQGKLKDIKARYIIPVELNAILHENAKIISEFYALAGNKQKAIEFATKSIEIREAIESVLWNEEDGIWYDYDLIHKQQRKMFAVTNLIPVWLKAYNPALESKITTRVLDYIKKTGIDDYPGGVPTTLYNSGEQWDYPNVWPPYQHAIIDGLSKLDNPEAKELAFKWAERWIRSNFVAYKRTQAMFEKYNAEELGGHGGGGEYGVQLGFGWTNGAIMDLLSRYGSVVTATGNSGLKSVEINPALTALLVAGVVSLHR